MPTGVVACITGLFGCRIGIDTKCQFS